MEPDITEKTADKTAKKAEQSKRSAYGLYALLAFVIVSGLIVWIARQVAPSEIEYRLHAEQLAGQQDWQGLEALAEKWRAHHPESGMSHAARADAMRMRGHFAEAENEYDQALGKDADHHEVWAHLGIMRLESGKYPEARAACRKSVALQADHAPGWYCATLAHAELGEIQAVKESLSALAKLDPRLHGTALGIIKNHVCMRQKHALADLCL